MITVSRHLLEVLIAQSAIDADERTICSVCGAYAYIYVKYAGAIPALRAIEHVAPCEVVEALRALDEAGNDDPTA